MSDSCDPWTIAHGTLLSMGFPMQECWSGLSFPSPGDLPDPGMEPGSSALAGIGKKIFYHWVIWEAPTVTKKAIQN